MSERLAFTPRAWAQVQGLLPVDWVAQFSALGALQRKREFHSAAQVLFAVLSYIAAERPFDVVAAALMERAGLRHLSGVALYKRFCAAGPFLVWLVEQLGVPRTRHPRWRRPVVAIDGTVVTRQGAIGTDVRVHTLVDVWTGWVVAARITDHTVGKHLRVLPLRRRDLVVADRGYGNRTGVAAVVAAKADLLVRVPRGTLPLWTAPGHRLDPTALLAAVPAHGVRRRRAGVWLPDGSWVWGTLLITRTAAPEEAGDAADPWDGFLILWTTLPYAQAPGALVGLYRERWRVERFYCRMKTTGGTDKAPHRKPRNALTWTAGRVVLIQLADCLAAQAEAPLPSRGPATARAPAQPGARVPALV